MKRHKFVTMTSEFGNLDYILRFGATTERKIRLSAPLLFNFPAGKDGPLMLPSSMSSWSSVSFITPWRALCSTRRSMASSHLSRGRPSLSMVRGLLLLRAQDLPHGRTLGLRCMHRKPHTTLGLTRTTPEQEAPGGSSCYQLRPKA